MGWKHDKDFWALVERVEMPPRNGVTLDAAAETMGVGRSEVKRRLQRGEGRVVVFMHGGLRMLFVTKLPVRAAARGESK